jgi:hypothetical protein
MSPDLNFAVYTKLSSTPFRVIILRTVDYLIPVFDVALSTDGSPVQVLIIPQGAVFA